MKTKITEATLRSALERAGQLFSRIACLGAVILVCSGASAQNLFVSGTDANGGEIFKFTWDGGESIFASGLYRPADLTFDTAGNLFVMDYEILDSGSNAAIYKITPNGMLTIFASRLSYLSSLAADQTGILFVADYNSGIIYKYKPTGSRATFASGLYHPAGMAFDSTGNLFVVDNSAGNIYQGSIYEYRSDGSRVTFAVLEPSDRPSGLAFDSMGNLYMADLGGNVYKYNVTGVLRRQGRTIFCSVPNSAQSLAFDSAGNLLVVNVVNVVNTDDANGNAVYKFTAQGARSMFASGQALSETFSHIAFQPIPTSNQ
jgi:sugar lactone lactonase YvrE